jgi:calcineurin-like phosphoesterase family protein
MSAVALALAVTAAACTSSPNDVAAQSPTSAVPGESPSRPVEETTDSPVIAAVGDLVCGFGTKQPPHHAGSGAHGECEPEKVAHLVTRGAYDAFLPLGDLQYTYGSLWRFEKYWDRYYGSVTNITRPVPGNHEGYNGRFVGYFGYFGKRAHPPGGYYSFDLGDWHIVALNSQLCRNKVWGLKTHLPSSRTATGFTRWQTPIPGGGCRPGDPMVEWLERDLAAHPNSEYACTLAYFHHPVYRWTTYKVREADRDVLPIWRVLESAEVDLVLTGHQHNYQRWQPMDAHGNQDPNGMTQFIVGTGGDSYQPLPDESERPETVAAAQTGSYGILQVSLHPSSYEFEFIPAPGQPSYEDAGTRDCR